VFRSAIPGPPEDDPTAVQWKESTQEIPVKFVTVDGKLSGDHEVPPFVVTIMLGKPVAVL
jgi:hypothetical protein